jgi:glycosyltransferase involved in cell wall biosynthesis
MIGPDKDGSLNRCRQYAQSKNLPVTFTGKLSKEEWRAKSKDFDIFLNTTNFDNTPVSVIEAMALGMPVVSTDVGGIPHLVTNEVNGLLVPPNDEAAITLAVKKLCGDPNLTEKLSKNAREKVEEFDWQIVKQHWIKLLKQ